jgi:uncharacterized OsmC-like protein
MKPTLRAFEPIALLLAAALACAAPAFAQEASKAPAKPAADAEAKSGDEAQITVKGAKNEAAVKAKLRADALLARCVIKPVMTDEEIQLCVTAYKQTR